MWMTEVNMGVVSDRQWSQWFVVSSVSNQLPERRKEKTNPIAEDVDGGRM